MQNPTIAEKLNDVADLLELEGANSFRVRAYRNAARTIESLTQSLSDMVERGEDLEELPNIGKDLAEKLTALVNEGELKQLQELKQRVPPGVLDVLRIDGLGPKKAATLWKELGVTDLDQLQAAAESGDVASLKGFGKKTAEKILANIDRVSDRRFLRVDARNMLEPILETLRAADGIDQVSPAGSYRRRRETVGDLDVLVTAKESKVAMDTLADHEIVVETLSRGDTKMRVRLENDLELDLRVVPEQSYGAAMHYFTGSKAHNVRVRRRGQERDLKINEYGVFRGDERIAGATEEEVFEAVDLRWIPPELREDRGEFEAAEAGELPDLIELSDIRGDLHMHTTASDGKNSIREMAEAAKQRGLDYIAITDHSKRVSMANGLDAKRLRKHWKEIDEINADLDGIEVLKGIECDILEDATLDLDDEVLSEGDWVIAVLHYGLKQPSKQIMKRLLAAIENPHVHAIGHPTGRILEKRPEAEIDFGEFFAAAKEHGVLLEINAGPERLDLDDVRAKAACEHGIPLVINTDAHSTRGLANMQLGVDQARRSWLTKSDVANTRTLKQFQKLLRKS
ncbi:DNA polymerase/3'-5' exonuclease PolX [Stratiformator vulcanicus]|uniref:DNA polymerase/3'-5' exonuclease PolX n=1 Tax=Stratiformator vulcanicus TaxID=2527980 RepID=UPI0011A174F8|nr:DNA polymerase/3'-5' exonuclease PolX [Stratiformator vulcanicus]